MATLEIVKEFPKYRYPGPRYRYLGLQSGEEFREEYFIPWLKNHLSDSKIVLDINGFAAYPPSFFKEFILGTAEKLPEYKKALKRAKIECKSQIFRERVEKIIREIT